MRKLNNKRRKEDIIRLRAEGKSYRQIQKILGCSKSTIAYHCDGGKEKSRVLSQLKSRKAICRKVSSFKVRCSKANYLTLRAKVKTFKRKNTRPGNRTNIYVNNISKNFMYPKIYHLKFKVLVPLTKVFGIKKIFLNNSF